MKLTKHLAALRNQFTLESLDEKDVNDNPFKQFDSWLNQAIEAKVNEPIACCLSTADTNGKPTSRIVYVHHAENEGFMFYTNYKSIKGEDLALNPLVCLNFFWPELQRQIRIEGKAKKISKELSDTYFAQRPRTSKIGAWASKQSQEIPNRTVLERRIMEYTKKNEDKPVPRPAHWGGYIVLPESIEFWQGRESRLHDRIVLEKEGMNWRKFRRNP